jgi:hypothetical protein
MSTKSAHASAASKIAAYRAAKATGTQNAKKAVEPTLVKTPTLTESADAGSSEVPKVAKSVGVGSMESIRQAIFGDDAKKKTSTASTKKMAAQQRASAFDADAIKSVLDVPGQWSIGAVNTEVLYLGQNAIVIDNVNGELVINFPLTIVNDLSLIGDLDVDAPTHIHLKVANDGLFHASMGDFDPSIISLPPGTMLFSAIDQENIPPTGGVIFMQESVGVTLVSANTAISIASFAGDVTIGAEGDLLLNGSKTVDPAYAEYLADSTSNDTKTFGEVIVFPGTAVEQKIERAAGPLAPGSFVLPDVGFYEVSWRVHLQRGGPAATNDSLVGIYVDDGEVEGTTTIGGLIPPATPNVIGPNGRVLRTVVRSTTSGTTVVANEGRCLIKTLVANTAISIRNASTVNSFVCVSSPAWDNLVIRRIDRL